jgi:hypothetical protein
MITLIAATNNFTTLDITGAAPKTAYKIVHWWTADGTNYILVCEVHDMANFRHLTTYITNHGGVAIARVTNPTAQVGAAFAALIPASHGVLATDTSYAAQAKILAGSGWAHVDPDN